MKGILVLLLLSGAVESFLYFPNIQDLKDFTNIDFGQRQKATEETPLDLAVDNKLDVEAQLANKNMYWKMVAAMKQAMAMNLRNLKKEPTESTKAKTSCQDHQYFFCRI